MEFEIKIIEFLQSGRNIFFDRTFQLISLVGSFVGVIALCLFFLLFKRRLCFWYLLSYGFVYLFVNLIKVWVGRVRPYNVTDTIVSIGDTVTDYCFPSGHAACAAVIAIFLGYFLFQMFKKKSTRVGIVCFCSLFVGLVCLSRMYLGKHFLTDVVAGVALSALICGIFLTLKHFYDKKRIKHYENKNANNKS